MFVFEGNASKHKKNHLSLDLIFHIRLMYRWLYILLIILTGDAELNSGDLNVTLYRPFQYVTGASTVYVHIILQNCIS